MTDEKKEVIEREYNVNLKREIIKAPNWNRAKKAVKALREFVTRHMKVKEVKISNKVNELIWSRGNKNPVWKLKIKVKKEGDVAYVELAQ